jgi:hypothetical protein
MIPLIFLKHSDYRILNSEDVLYETTRQQVSNAFLYRRALRQVFDYVQDYN